MASSPIEDALNRRPPFELAQRRVRVARDRLTTIRVPADSDGQFRRWYPPGIEPTEGNEVKYLIDGPDTFSEIARVLRLATNSRHFIYFCAWWIDPDEPLDPSAPGSTLRELFTVAGKAGVEIRLLLYRNYTQGLDKVATVWQQQLVVTKTQTNFIDLVRGFKNGWAVSDYRVPTEPFGAHHQKLMLVYGAGGLTAFCGGIDLNADRIQWRKTPDSPGSPLHDVHCRVRGPAALDLLSTFVERWNDHPDATKGGVRVPLLGATYGRDFPTGTSYVGVGKTYANGTRHPLPKPSIASYGTAYSFAPNGLRTAEALALNAIANANRFIYIEDQYFFSVSARDALIAAFGRGVQHVTVVLTWPAYMLPLMNDHRRDQLRSIRAVGKERLRICFLQPEQDRHTYVHSKMTIVDDEFVSIGSANYNRRSFTHDSEVVAGMVDQHTPGDVVFNLAHRLRIAMWAEHLNMKTGAGYAELADGVASAVHFLDPPPGARVVPYYEDDPNQPMVTNAVQTSIAPYLALLEAADVLGFSYAQTINQVLGALDPTKNPLTPIQLWGLIDPDGA